MPPEALSSTSSSRIYYIDNLRIFLIALVVLHHLAITYGAPGGWYYREGEVGDLSMIPFSLFVATNQSFFMGLFFFISAFFTVPSFDRKGPGAFLRDRLLRLGVPLLFYYFVLSPLTIYLLVRYGREEAISFWDFLKEHQGFGFGPMWFVEALIYFTLIYLLYRLFGVGRQGRRWKWPGALRTGLFALVLGLCTFAVRIWLPVGWSLEPLDLQLPHFLQYISLFILGLIAYRSGWPDQISYRLGRGWFLFAQACIFGLFPLLFILGGASEGHIEPFMGGLHWQSLSYSVWEQMVGFALIIGLAGIFKEKVNRQGRLARALSASAYTVYIIHPPVLVGLALLGRPLVMHPFLKFMLLAPVAVVLVFTLANQIRRLPLVRKVV